MLVSAAKRPRAVTPIQVPPACRARPPMIQGPSSQQPSGRLGRAWTSSRLAATTNGWEWSGRQAKTIRHMGHLRSCRPARVQARRRKGPWPAGGSASASKRQSGIFATMPVCFAGTGRMEFLLYLLLGGFAGVLAGLFGVGGGLIIVPVLVFSFSAQGFSQDILTHLAVGTSLATIVFTSVNSILTHHRLGAVRWPMVLWMTFGILLGAALGSLTAAAIQGPMLQKIIGVFALAMAVQMGFDLRPKATGRVPGRPELSL